MSYYRTPEHRAMRAEQCRRVQPWKNSTGPKTPEGKAISARNSYKGGLLEEIRELSRLLKEQAEELKRIR